MRNFYKLFVSCNVFCNKNAKINSNKKEINVNLKL